MLTTPNIIRPIRSQSGVTPFAVMTKPYPCPGQCTYCPLESGMPKSYLSDEPAAARAKILKFDPFTQVQARLTHLVNNGHSVSKIELIIIGGTFSSYPKSYRRVFVKSIFDAVNGVESSCLEEAQVTNETSERRVVGLSVETRPDWINAKEVRFLRELGVTKIQLGVQAFDEQILLNIKRGHTLGAVTYATRILKDAGLKICYHFMPNLPGSTPEHDLEMARLMYQDKRFKPDFVKIYPVSVIEGTTLYEQWKKNEFVVYDDATLKKVLTGIKRLTPSFVRIDRLVRDISCGWVSAGTHTTNMRQLIHQEMKKEGWSCSCIRCREARTRTIPAKLKLCNLIIPTHGGLEHLLTYEDKTHLYSLLRLRLPSFSQRPVFPELRECALVREVHTYGSTVPVGMKGETGKSQHFGLGKKLLNKAEILARKAGYPKIAVIAAIGTREYYRHLGYQRAGLYMLKSLL